MRRARVVFLYFYNSVCFRYSQTADEMLFNPFSLLPVNLSSQTKLQKREIKQEKTKFGNNLHKFKKLGNNSHKFKDETILFPPFNYTL